MAAKRGRPAKQAQTPTQEEPTKSSVLNYLKFGESYTSLILGIVVVIIATVLLLSFVHNKNVNRTNMANQEIANALLTVQPSTTIALSATPTTAATPTMTVTPTSTPNPTVKTTATPKPTEKKVTPTLVAKKVSPTPTVKPKQKNVSKGGTYTIVEGDTLWKIAEKVYKDGYKWPEIARVNNLSNPGLIHVGNKIKLPVVDQKNTTAKKGEKGEITKKAASTKAPEVKTDRITSDTYKIKKGDNLWDIAVRAYGDGYKWPEIAKANKLSDPGLVHADNTIKIPRGK